MGGGALAGSGRVWDLTLSRPEPPWDGSATSFAAELDVAGDEALDDEEGSREAQEQKTPPHP